MHPALDVSRLHPLVQKALAPDAPEKLLLGAAKGVLPGVKPGDVLAAVAALSEHSNPEIGSAAAATLRNFPAKILEGILASDLEPGPIDVFARAMVGQDDILERLVQMPRVAVETLARLAATGSERLTELIATNEARALAEPVIIEKLYLNPNTRMSTSNRLVDLALRNNVEVKGIPFREIGDALQEELIPEAEEGLSPADEIFLEVNAMAASIDEALAADGGLLEDLEELAVAEDGATLAAAPPVDPKKKKKKEETGPLHARIGDMSISEKIRMATIGPGAARAMLLKDTNKLVASAAIRSPMIQEQDVERIARMRTVHDEVLRIIATKGEWTENHAIKYNLVANPRTPLAHASRFIAHLREDELKRLEKSRDVSAPVRGLARQMLQRKAKKAGGKLARLDFAPAGPRQRRRRDPVQSLDVHPGFVDELPGFLARAGHQIIRRPRRHHPALDQQEGPVRYPERARHVVTDHQVRRSEPLPRLLDQIVHQPRCQRVQPRGRLVVDQHLRLEHQRPRQAHPLALPTRQLRWEQVLLVHQPQRVQHPHHLLADLRLRQLRVLDQRERHVFQDRQRVEQRRVLKNHTELAPEGV
jgi:hypothetical protein